MFYVALRLACGRRSVGVGSSAATDENLSLIPLEQKRCAGEPWRELYNVSFITELTAYGLVFAAPPGGERLPKRITSQLPKFLMQAYRGRQKGGDGERY